ncbi:MAG TPA: hypothetical protein PLP83_05905 [Candidatus Aminicenantes bacterium]|nr:hypothetical protein [Candidatus Aminicenantes bacterium]
MVATETAKSVLLVLLGLAVLWIVVIVVKNDMETIVRALVVAAVIGGALYLVARPGASVDGKISFASIKDYLFPVPERSYAFERKQGYADGRPVTIFVFDDPGPPLSLAMVEGGKYMAIKDLRTVNNVLKLVGLPPVAAGVAELASITGKSIDADKYKWDDYERGVLVIERGLCRDMTMAQSFPCIATIRVTER